jgi:hypothetical protein
MSTVPAKESERSRDGAQGRGRRLCSVGKPGLGRPGNLLLRLERPHMRVKLCDRCPYTPQDLGGHYDAEGTLHVCARCDGQHEASTSHYPREAHRRQQCATVPSIFATAQPSVARSATDNLVSSGTIPGKPPSVQRNAPSASRPAVKATANGYRGFTRLDGSRSEHLAELSRSSGFRSKEVAQ